MLSFVVLASDGSLAAQWPIHHAYLVGSEGAPVPGTIGFDAGFIRVEKASVDSAALALQFRPDAVPDEAPDPALPRAEHGPGVLTLQTTLLPDREKPYLLTLELARHRIMLFLEKLEEWGLSDLPATHPIMVRFDRARAAFTQALMAQRGAPDSPSGGWTAAADSAARQALSIALDASERLAMHAARLGLESRLAGRAYSAAVERYIRATSEKPAPGASVAVPHDQRVHLPGVPALGVAVSPQLFNDGLQKVLLGACDFITMPMRWLDLEPSEGQYAFAATDRWIEWAVRAAKLPIVGGPLVEIRPSCMPEWLSIWEHDYETFRELVYEHIQKVVVRYRRTVARWTVCGGLHINSNFKLAFEQIMDLTRVCVLLVRKLQPGAKIMVEIAHPWGEYHALDSKSLPPLMYADALAQSGLPIDALGLRLQIGRPAMGKSTRDLAAISALLDRYAAFEKPIALTAVGAPSGDAPARDETGGPAGYWRQPWSEFAQSDFLAALAAVACGKSYIQSFCWQDLADLSDPYLAPEMPLGGLVAAAGAAKPAATRLTQIRASLRGSRSFIVS